MRSQAIVLCVALCLGLASAAGPLEQEVTGTVISQDGKVGDFKGILKLNGVTRYLNLIGFTGSLTHGQVIWRVTNKLEDLPDVPLAAPSPTRKLLAGGSPIMLTGITGSCDILHLTLGPLHLDLLGLQVDLNQVNLDIVANSGPGNLLGNLLCAVANLLNGGLNLNALTIQLTRVVQNLLGPVGR